MAKQVKKRSANWTVDETKKLISVWQDKYLELRAAKRNASVYNKIELDLKALDVKRSVDEIKNRMKCLETRYRNENKKSTGSSPSNWEFYSLLNCFIGQSAVNTHSTTDSIEDDGDKSAQSSQSEAVDLSAEQDSLEGAAESEENTQNPQQTDLQGNDEEVENEGSKRVLSVDSESDREEEEMIQPKITSTPTSGGKVVIKKRKRTIDVISEHMTSNQQFSREIGAKISESISSFTPFMKSLAESLSAFPALVMQLSNLHQNQAQQQVFTLSNGASLNPPQFLFPSQNISYQTVPTPNEGSQVYYVQNDETD